MSRAGFDSPPPAKTQRVTEMADSAVSPHQQVRPKYTPEEEKHKLYNMKADRAEAMLNLVRRARKDDLEYSTRGRAIAVVKRKLMNQIRIPTRSRPTFHLYRELDLMTCQAAKSIFFDLKRTGPTRRGKAVYYNFETDSLEVMRAWFKLEERRPTGMGNSLMRGDGSVLVMARPPMLEVEHQSHDEAEGIKITCEIMTLNSRGVPRFAMSIEEEEIEEELEERRDRLALAKRDTEFAFKLVCDLAELGSCKLDPNWYRTLAKKFGPTWLSYLSDKDENSSEPRDEDSEDCNSEELDTLHIG